MAKLTLADLASLQNEATAVTTLNSNSAGIETAMENTLSRNGATPNQMLADLDMNGKSILNLPPAVNPTSPVRRSEYEFDTALLTTLENQVASLVVGTPGTLFTTDRITTTGGNPYVAGVNDLDNADIVLKGSPRHDTSIMMWSATDANRLSSQNLRFNFDSYLTTGGAGAYITGAVGGESYFSGPMMFKDGRPWTDVRTFGVGLATNDDWAPAIQAAINHIVNQYGGGTVLVPPNNGGNPYVCLSDITVPANVTLRGSGGNTCILGNGHNDFSIILNGMLSSLQDIQVYGKGSNNDPGAFVGATKSPVVASASSVEARIINVWAVGGLHNFEIRGADALMFNSKAMGGCYGSSMVYVTAGSWIMKNKIDYSLPFTPTNISSLSAIPARLNSTVYAQGALVSESGFILQAITTTGTTGGSAPTFSYGVMTDGTVQWVVVSANTMYALQVDGPVGASISEVQITQCDFSGGYMAGIALTNTQSGGNPPQEVKVSQSVFGQHLLAGVWIISGGKVNVTDCEMAGGLLSTGAAIIVGNLSTGDNCFVGNEMAGTLDVIAIQGGINNIVTGNRIYGGTHAGVYVWPNVGKFIITNNFLGSGTVVPGNACPVIIDAGTGDNFVVTNNVFAGAGVNISNAATGTHQAVANNVGF